MEKIARVFCSFEDAEKAELDAMAALTPQQRVDLLLGFRSRTRGVEESPVTSKHDNGSPQLERGVREREVVVRRNRLAFVIFGVSLVALVGFTASEPKEKAMSNDAPLACKLAPPELAQRRAELEAEIFNGILETRELEDGYGFRFPESDEWVQKLTQLILFERECCSFFRFELIVEPEHGPVWINLRGGPEVKSFIAVLVPRLNKNAK